MPGAQDRNPRPRNNRVILWASAALLLLGVLTAWVRIAEPVWPQVVFASLPTIFVLALFTWWLCLIGVALSQERWWLLTASLIVFPFIVVPIVVVIAFFVECARGPCF